MSSYQQRRQQVQNLLQGLPYKQKSAVEIQILQLLHQIHSLRPQIDNYVFNDGTQQQLFKLGGTIPIQYKSQQYNIPVAFWLPLNFPTMCPICYVTPVAGMKIKQKHMHVDSQGLVYHPYLHSWKVQQSNLVELVGLLCSVFGKEPPLYAAKGKAAKPIPRQSPVYQRPVQSMHSMHNPMHNPSSQQNSQPISRVSRPMVKPKEAIIPKKEVKPDTNTIVERKLRSELQKIYNKENEQVNSLSTAQKQLEIHTNTIDDVQSKQNIEKNQLLQRRQNLQMKIQALEQWLKANENDDKIDVDAVVQISDTWSQQCMQAVSHDFAITDVMLELDRCLEDETIKLDQYLKQISRLARDQFSKKAMSNLVFRKQDQLVRQQYK